jgi:uncharacterized membrane protein YhhN
MNAYWSVMTVLLVLLLVLHARGWWRLEWLVKPAAAATFVAYGVASGGLEHPSGRVLVAGLGLAALGDVLLIPKNEKAFLGGLGAFLAGHVAYAIAFGMRGVDAAVTLASLGLFGLLAVPVVRWLWPSVARPMRGPVAAYVLVITSMVAIAAGAAFRNGASWLLVGALAFYASDLAVARDQFVKREFPNRAWGMPLYFYAQMILASQAGG